MTYRRIVPVAISLLMFGMSGAPPGGRAEWSAALQSFVRAFPGAYVQTDPMQATVVFATGFHSVGPVGTPAEVAATFLTDYGDVLGLDAGRSGVGAPATPLLVDTWYSPGGGHRLLFVSEDASETGAKTGYLIGVIRRPEASVSMSAPAGKKAPPGYVFVAPSARTESAATRSDWSVYFVSRVNLKDENERSDAAPGTVALMHETGSGIVISGASDERRVKVDADATGRTTFDPCPGEGVYRTASAQAYLTNPLNGEPAPVTVQNLCDHSPLTLHGRMVVVEPVSGTLPTSNTNQFLFDPNTPEFDDVAAYFHADNFFTLMANRGFPVPYGTWHTTINSRSPTIATARSYYPTRSIILGPPTPPYKNVVYEAAVIAHEVTHLLMYDLSASYLAWGLKENFALGEAYADYFGLVYRSHQLGHAEPWQQPVIGAWLVDETTWNLPRDLSASEPHYSGLSSVNYVGLADHDDPITVYDNSVIFSTALVEYDRIDGSDNSSSFVIEALLNHTEDLKFLPARNALMAAVDGCAMDPVTQLLECCATGRCHNWVEFAFDKHGISGPSNAGVESFETVDTSDDRMLTVESAYPNPFLSTTRLTFNLTAPGDVRLRFYDASGKLVDEVLNRFLPSGRHMAEWTPRGLSSGTYFFEINTQSSTSRGSVVYAR